MTVSISERKARLSAFLDLVRRGEDVLVTDRGRASHVTRRTACRVRGRPVRFWDASALVPRCLEQPRSEQAMRVLRLHPLRAAAEHEGLLAL